MLPLSRRTSDITAEAILCWKNNISVSG
jgi:hypothetical protein